MLAFHNDPAIKEEYLNKDETMEDILDLGEIGISDEISYIVDYVSKFLKESESIEIYRRFISSIEVGADLSEVWFDFMTWILVDDKYGVINYGKTDKEISYIRVVASAVLSHKETTYEQWCNLNFNRPYHTSGASRCAGWVTSYFLQSIATSLICETICNYSTAVISGAELHDYENQKEAKKIQFEKLLELISKCKKG